MKKVTIVKQHDITDCGPACLSSIIKYYSGYVPIEVIRLKCETDHNGTSAYNLMKAAESYGFKATAIKVNNINELTNRNVFPCIVHLKLKNNLNHYAVLYQISNKSVCLMDPAIGKTKMDLDEFIAIYTNITIILQPQSTLMKYDKPNTIHQIVRSFFVNNKKTSFKLLFYSFALVIISVMISYFIKCGSTILNGDFGLTILIYIIYIYLFFYTIKNFIDYTKNKLITYINKNVSAELYSNFSHQLFILPLNFIKSKTSGEIISRYNELQQINKMISEIIISTSLDLIMALISLIFSFFISYELSLISIFIMFVYFCVNFAFKNPTLQKINQNITLSSEFNTNIIDNVNTIISTKFTNNEENMEKRLERSGSSYLYNNMKLENYINKCSFIKNMIYDLGKWFVISFGLYLCLTKKLTVIDLFTFEMVISYFYESIKDISSMLPSLCYFKSSLYKLNEFSIIKEEDKGTFKFKAGDIKLNNLSYSYDNYNYAVKNENFIIKEKEKVLLQGCSGSGKSTICQLLSRQIESDNGIITIGDININDIKIKDFRKNITYIGQKDSLLVDTILKNIIYERKIMDKELQEICRICEIDEIVNKKTNRYNTLINESSMNISGGEKQRIILARGLLDSGKIIILDEALSEVNMDMEERILKKIFSYFKNRTIIYVSHKKYKGLFNRTITIGSNA